MQCNAVQCYTMVCYAFGMGLLCYAGVIQSKTNYATVWGLLSYGLPSYGMEWGMCNCRV